MSLWLAIIVLGAYLIFSIFRNLSFTKFAHYSGCCWRRCPAVPQLGACRPVAPGHLPGCSPERCAAWGARAMAAVRGPPADDPTPGRDVAPQSRRLANSPQVDNIPTSLIFMVFFCLYAVLTLPFLRVKKNLMRLVPGSPIPGNPIRTTVWASSRRRPCTLNILGLLVSSTWTVWTSEGLLKRMSREWSKPIKLISPAQPGQGISSPEAVQGTYSFSIQNGGRRGGRKRCEHSSKPAVGHCCTICAINLLQSCPTAAS